MDGKLPKMKVLLYSLLFIVAGKVYSQKPIVDAFISKNFGGVGNGIISTSGRYVSYNYYDPSEDKRLLIIKATDGGWEQSFANGNSAIFSNDKLVFKIGSDTLCLLTPGTNDVHFINQVNSFKLFNGDGNIYLGYELKGGENNWAVRNLETQAELKFSSVRNFIVSPEGKHIVICKSLDTSANKNVLQVYNLMNSDLQTIWSGEDTENMEGGDFDQGGEQFVFSIGKKKIDHTEHEIWYFKFGMKSASLLINKNTPGIDSGLVLSDRIPKFSKDGTRIFIGVEPANLNVQRSSGVMVDVWSYQDAQLQSVQLNDLVNRRIYTAVFPISLQKVIRLEQSNESISNQGENWVIVMHHLGLTGIYEAGWNPEAYLSYYLISTADGTRLMLRDSLDNLNEGLGLSPGGKWCIYYDYKEKNYFSYEISTGKIRNITSKCSAVWTREKGDLRKPNLSWYPWEKTWLMNDEAVLISDNYDIWQIDPRGIKVPINITNGYGRSHLIKFGLATDPVELQNCPADGKWKLLLNSFNRQNKDMGFYSKELGSGGNPKLLSTGSYLYGDVNLGNDTYENIQTANIKGGSQYLVLRQSGTQAPNYYLTADFKTFTAISNFQPHKKYNWITSELIKWKTFDGSISTGILYKPENFSAQIRYPIIFEYYESRSDMLNLFIAPKISDDRINIPWFVSRGYLVFVPDIHSKPGDPGKSSYNTIVSAAKYFSKMPWVDGRGMGLQGHSWGAFQTNYIITHSNIFAAACSVSGVSDLISAYASDKRGGYRNHQAERGQGRMGGTPWQIQHAYLTNSPILRADKVTTPLLLVNNKGDKVVPFEQGLEFFIALRRLKKTCWMLQYDDGHHSLGGESAMDFTIRMTQFFDHYLKLTPAPYWMTKGVPAVLKGIENRYELDTPGRCSKDCKVCRELNSTAAKGKGMYK